MTEHERRAHSRTIVQGRHRAPARAMLKAVGFSDEDLAQPIVGIANTVAPEAAVGAPIAFVEEGDTIAFDVNARQLDLLVSESVLRERRARWRPRAPRYARGVFAKYVALVSSAAEGTVTNGEMQR